MNELHAFLDRDVIRVTLRGVPNHPGIAADVFGRLGTEGMNVELVVSSGRADGLADITLAVRESLRAPAVAALKALVPKIGAHDIDFQVEVALVGISGPGIAQQPGIAARVFRAISSKGLNIDLISTSFSSVVCMVDESWANDALESIRAEFGLGTA